MYLWRVLYYWSPGQCAIQKGEAILFACCLILVCAIVITTIHPYQMAVVHVGMKMRISCCSLLYRKVNFVHKCVINFNFYILGAQAKFDHNQWQYCRYCNEFNV